MWAAALLVAMPHTRLSAQKAARERQQPVAESERPWSQRERLAQAQGAACA